MSRSDESPAGADAIVPPAVSEAIADNPEAVARLLRQSGQLAELLDALALVEDSVDDRMVEGLSADATRLGLAATELAGEGTVELSSSVGANGTDLAAAVEQVAVLQRTGTLDQLVELADALALVTDAMDDRTVERLAGTGTSLGEVADTAADDDVRRGLVRTLEGVGRASAEEPASLGPLGLVGALRDSEVKAGMGYLVAVARGIGAANGADDEGRR